jgi:hypothetical protein
MLGGDLRRFIRSRQQSRDVHVAIELYHAAPLRQLAVRCAGGPLIAAHIAKTKPHLLQLDQAAVRLLLDLRGIERVDGMSVAAGLNEPHLHGGVPRIVQRLGGRTRDRLRLWRAQQHESDDEREQCREGRQAVAHRVRALRALSASR